MWSDIGFILDGGESRKPASAVNHVRILME